MDDLRLGAMLRAVRVKRGLRQCDVGQRAKVSDNTISRIERGHLESIAHGTLRRVAGALQVQVGFRAWSRDGDLERVLNERHGALAELVLATFERVRGWAVRAEVSFAVFGERGVVDLLAWHAATRSLLVIELKTEIVDVGELLATLGRKRRLALTVAAQFGWRPATVSVALIVSGTMTNRRRVKAHARTFGTELPDDTGRLASFLRRPVGSVAAVAFVSDRHVGTTRDRIAGRRRVRPAMGARRCIGSSTTRADAPTSEAGPPIG